MSNTSPMPGRPNPDDLPHDETGDALRRLLASGADFSLPHAIDFRFALPDEAAGAEFAHEAATRGYKTSLAQRDEAADDGPPTWICTCTVSMLPAHADIEERESDLEALAAPLGGWCDGWGAFAVCRDDLGQHDRSMWSRISVHFRHE